MNNNFIFIILYTHIYINVRLLPVAHTCFNDIDVYRFPNNTTPQ